MKKDNSTFSIIMDEFGWRSKSSLPFIDDRLEGYFLNGFYAYYQRYYMVVKGQMPIKKAIKLYEKVDKALAVRAGGHCANVSPENYLEHKKLEKFWEKLTKGKTSSQLLKEFKELDFLYKEKKEELMKSNYEDFYVSCYHIDTWEGFKFFSKFIKENKIRTNWFE